MDQNHQQIVSAIDGGQKPGPESRQAARYPVDRRVVGEHRQLGEVPLHLTNISTSGFMSALASGLSRGDRVVVRLPHVGRIEAHLSWAQRERAGFQLERIIRDDDFAVMIAAMQRHDRAQPVPSVPPKCHHRESVLETMLRLLSSPQVFGSVAPE